MTELPALNEQALNGFQVTFTQGNVEIVGYNEIYKSLQLLSDYLHDVEVTEDNIKENKKLVARIAKATKQMNSARIENKKRFLEPFNIYEKQVKTLTKLVNEAEETVREQIREFDEIEREEKREKIQDIFEKRKRPYKYSRFMEFENFIKPQHLNKSTTVSKVETEIADWLNNMNNDIETLDNLSIKMGFDFPEAIHRYLKTQSVAETINYILEKKELEEEIQEQIIEAKKNPTRDQVDTFVNVIMKKKDFQKIQPILEGMDIEYSCA